MTVRFTNLFKSIDLSIPDDSFRKIDTGLSPQDNLPEDTLRSLRNLFPRTPVNDLMIWSLVKGIPDTPIWS